MRACVIGAGAAGLTTARHLSELSNWQITLYEFSDQIGGLWAYAGVQDQENGLSWHSSMYKNLRTNLPKQVMEYPDFPFPTELPSFLSRTHVHEYLQNYAKHFDLLQYIKLKHEVLHVDRKIDQWSVTCKNLLTNEITVECFDSVIVCNGHYNKPNIPDIRNANKFRGVQIHSTNYRVPEKFSKLRVALLGAGPSGVDIALDLCAYAEKVYLCHKEPILECALPENFTQSSPIMEMTENGIITEHGDEIPIDAIIYCTGYEYSFPFLSKLSIQLKIDNWRISPLYLHMIYIDQPSLYFVGIPTIIMPFKFVHVQAKFIASILGGKSVLPSREEMLEWETDDYERRTRILRYPQKKAHYMGSEQMEFLRGLAKMGGFTLDIPDVIGKLYDYVREYRPLDLLGYHEVNFVIVDDENFHVSKG